MKRRKSFQNATSGRRQLQSASRTLVADLRSRADESGVHRSLDITSAITGRLQRLTGDIDQGLGVVSARH